MINFYFKPLQPTITGEIETPVAVSSVEFIDPREPVLVNLFRNLHFVCDICSMFCRHI